MSTLIKNKIKLQDGDIEAIESKFDIELPSKYKEFMLKYNGTKTNTPLFFFNENEQIRFFEILPFRNSILESVLSIEEIFNDDQNILPTNYFTIGVIEGGWLAISADASNYGSIFVYYSDVELEKVADSFTDFINNLTE